MGRVFYNSLGRFAADGLPFGRRAGQALLAPPLKPGPGGSLAMEIPASLANALRAARSVAVLTGAGISAESGVPTFRDAMTGLWARYNPEDLATPEAFLRDPKLVWEWYEWRRGLVAKAQPNPGHRALAELERRVPDFTLTTQNVDGLHRRAGSRRVLELHGNITRHKCFDEGTPVESWADTGSVPPLCPRCGGYLRPDVVWFGEMLPEAALEAALEAARRCELFLCVGTSTVVQPAASLPFEALRAGAQVLEVNPDATPLTPHAAWSLRGPAGMVLPELLAAL
ncbi:MAG TPA: NAD-dependent deacylase [Burkholderiales bacterium]